MRAARALQSADVVLYDDLVAPGTLDLARREAHKVHVGKRGYKPSCTQEDITRMMVSLAGEGRRVVRLKGGDPMIFGRAGEEIAALRAAGVDVEVVPGVTAASGAAASLGLSLTLRDWLGAARAIHHRACMRGGKLPDDFDWKALTPIPLPRRPSIWGLQDIARADAASPRRGIGARYARRSRRAPVSWPDGKALRLMRRSPRSKRRRAPPTSSVPASFSSAGRSPTCRLLSSALAKQSALDHDDLDQIDPKSWT